MRKAWWYLVGLALMAWQFRNAAINAFAVPWSWTLDQWLVVLYAACLCIGLGAWGFIWMRGGTAAVKARWSIVEQRLDAPRDKKVFRWSLVFWIAVALTLVVFFNMRQP